MSSKNTVNKHTQVRWDEAKRQARDELVRRAKERRYVTYAELCGLIAALDRASA